MANWNIRTDLLLEQVERWFRLTPLRLAVLSFLLVSAGLFAVNMVQGTLWRTSECPLPLLDVYSFPQWTTAPLLIPLLFWLLLRTYRRLPGMFRALFALSTSRRGELRVQEWTAIQQGLGRKYIDWGLALFCAVGVVVWILQPNPISRPSWSYSGPRSITAAGVYMAVSSSVVGFVIFRFGAVAFLCAVCLRRILLPYSHLRLRLRPWHPDGRMGLGKVGRVLYDIVLVLGCLGVLLAVGLVAAGLRLGVGEAVRTNWWYWVAVGSYTSAVVIVVGIGLLPVHLRMRRTKQKVIGMLRARREKAYMYVARVGRIPSGSDIGAVESALDRAMKLPVWPFDAGVAVRSVTILLMPILVQSLLTRLLG